MTVDRFTITKAVYEKVDNVSRRERDVHDAMLEAPVEEAPIYFAAMQRLRAERTEFLRMSARPSTADLDRLGLA